jgi:phosphonate transport system permease protein
VLRRAFATTVYAGCRTVIALMRSVHELIWAVLFLAAMGMSNLAAVIAIAIPYGGTLAKIFSEMIDEVPRDAARALRAVGATGAQRFCFGLLPRALPDMTAHTFYRFECALRSSAILGFFGFPTLGLDIRQSFNSSNYGEVWTYLYVLLGTVVVFDWWSGAVRRRLLG